MFGEPARIIREKREALSQKPTTHENTGKEEKRRTKATAKKPGSHIFFSSLLFCFLLFSSLLFSFLLFSSRLFSSLRSKYIGLTCAHELILKTGAGAHEVMS